jgi:hypothetical protein
MKMTHQMSNARAANPGEATDSNQSYISTDGSSSKGEAANCITRMTQAAVVPVFGRFDLSWPLTPTGFKKLRVPRTASPVEQAVAHRANQCPPQLTSWIEALTTRFQFDAHVAAYSAPAMPVRLSTGAAALCEGHVRMHLAIFDVDGPDHKASPEWRATEAQKAVRVLNAHRGGAFWPTSNGYRLCWQLPGYGIAADGSWSERYTAWCRYLRERFAIEADPACSDWTRAFRLPLVRRDGVPTLARGILPITHPSDPLPGFWDPPIAAIDPKAPAPYHPPSEVDTDALKLLEGTDIGRCYLRAIEHGTEGLEVYSTGALPDGAPCVYVRSPFAHAYTRPEGENHFAIIGGGGASGGVYSFHSTDRVPVSKHFERLREMCPKLGDERWDFMRCEWVPCALAVVVPSVTPPVEQAAANDVTQPDGQPASVPTVDLSGLQLHPQTGLPWVLRDKQACWLHSVDGEGYGPAVSKTDIRLEIRRTHNRVIALRTAKNADIPEPDFEQLYVQRAAEVVQTYVARTSTFDPATRRLTLAALRWTKRAPQHHADVESWLRALTVNDEQFERLNQWLAGLVALDRPAPILHIHGPAGIGKDLLVSGIASLWSGTPSLIDESLSDFNEASAGMPVIWSDEQLPSGTDFGWLRHAATARTRRVNMKYMSKVDVEGCARLVMTSNDPDILRFVRTGVLKRVDLDAVRERLLVINAQASRALATLSKLDTDAIASHQLAEHCLWLAATVRLEPRTSRMCAKPYGGEVSLEVHAGQRNAKVLRAIAARLPPPQVEADDTKANGVAEAPGPFQPPQVQAEGRPGEGVWLKPDAHSDEPPALLVNVRLLAACTADIVGRNPITEQDIRDCCDVYATGAGSLELRPPGSGRRSCPLNWRVLELARVRSAVRTLD